MLLEPVCAETRSAVKNTRQTAVKRCLTIHLTNARSGRNVAENNSLFVVSTFRGNIAFP